MSREFIRQYQKNSVAKDPNRGTAFAMGITVPTDGSVGYAPGCLFIDLNAAAGLQLFVNEGTKASSSFKAILPSYGNLSGLLASIAELNRVAQNSTREVAAGAATLALTVAAHEGRTVLIDQAAGCTITLPSAVAGIVGARFRIVISVTATSGSDIINVANANDIMVGQIVTGTDDATPYARCWQTANSGTTATESDTITLNRGTTGTASKGSWFEFECIAANTWAVSGMMQSSGAEATPFSAAV